jgi:hypothetical protein
MTLYEYDKERYQPKIKTSSVDVALWGAAIRDHLWMNSYKKLSETNNATFKMFLCGHKKPEYDLPDNVIFIYSKMSANACAEIAFRFALESNSKYMMFWQDDMEISEKLLDEMMLKIESNKEGDLVCGPLFRPTLKHQPCRADLDENGYLKGQPECVTGLHSIGIMLPIMKTHVSKIMGGLDKRFIATQNVTEQLLRLAVIGKGKVTFSNCHKVEIAEDMDVQSQLPGRTGRRLCRQWHAQDDKTLKQIWDFSWYPKKFRCDRKLENKFYLESELEFSIEEY